MVWLGALLLALGLGGGGFLGYRYYANRPAAAAPPQVAQSTPPETVPPKPSPVETPAETPPPDAATPPAAAPDANPLAVTPAKPAIQKPPRPIVKPPAPTGGASSLPMAALPQTSAQPQPAQTTPPANHKDNPPPAPASGYRGPTNGLVLWSGPLPKNEDVVVDGATTTVGLILSGALPGVPVNLSIEPKDVTVAEAPTAGNGFKRFSFHAKKGRKTVVTIYWTVQ